MSQTWNRYFQSICLPYELGLSLLVQHGAGELDRQRVIGCCRQPESEREKEREMRERERKRESEGKREGERERWRERWGGGGGETERERERERGGSGLQHGRVLLTVFFVRSVCVCVYIYTLITLCVYVCDGFVCVMVCVCGCV